MANIKLKERSSCELYYYIPFIYNISFSDPESFPTNCLVGTLKSIKSNFLHSEDMVNLHGIEHHLQILSPKSKILV